MKIYQVRDIRTIFQSRYVCHFDIIGMGITWSKASPCLTQWFYINQPLAKNIILAVAYEYYVLYCYLSQLLVNLGMKQSV